MKKELTKYKFSWGPWCIDTGRDSFGPPTRKEFSFAEKLKICKELGLDGVQLHDDDVIEDINEKTYTQIVKEAKQMKKLISEEGFEVEFIAPKLWGDKNTIDGAATSNNSGCIKYALERSEKAIDIANIMGTNKLLYFFGRDGTYVQGSKDPKLAIGKIVDFINALLEYDRDILILGETKPNEPMDQIFCPTAGHFIGVSYKTIDPKRVGVYIESAHCTMCGLEPADEMGYALWHNKLWGVHLDDQNGLKFNEHRTFGVINLLRGFRQVEVLEKNGYGKSGEYVGLETRAIRTQSNEKSFEHLKNSREMFLTLLEIIRGLDYKVIGDYIQGRNYEELEMFVLRKIMGF